MRFEKVLCGITAATVILGSMTAISSSEILRAEAVETKSGSITENGITYVMNSDGSCTITEISDEYCYPPSSEKVFLAFSEGASSFYTINSILRKSGATAIKVDPKVPYFYAKDGVLFAERDGNKFLYFVPHSKNVTTYTVPDGVTGIVQWALDDSIETVNIPASVTIISDAIGGGARGIAYFLGADNLKQINVDPNNKEYCSIDGVLFNKGKSDLLAYPSGRSASNYVVPDGVSDITALGGSFDSLYIPTSVTVSPMYIDAKDVYYAGSEAQFKKIECPCDVVTHYFYDHCKEDGIKVHYNVKAPSKTNSNIIYRENKDGTLTALVAESARETITSLTVPETVNGKKVTAFTTIESESDYGYAHTYNGYTLPELKSISLPASLKEFEQCDGEQPFPKLTEIKVDSKNPVMYVKDNVLFKKHDKGVTMVLYPSGKTNTSYTIPEGVTDSDFRQSLRNDYLKTLNFPSTLADVGDAMTQGAGRPLYAGYYFANVNKINVDPNNKTYASPDGNLYSKDMTRLIKYLGDDKTFIVPDGVKSIENRTFEGDTIYIPKSVKKIDNNFFLGNVKDIYYAGSEDEWKKIFGFGDLGNGYIYLYISDKTTVHFNTPAPTAAPTKPTFSVTSKGVTLNWSKVNGATAYIIKYSLDGGKTWITKTVTTNSITLSDLKPNTPYIYKIASKNGKTESPFSPNYTFKTKGDDSEPTSDPTSDPTSNPTSDPTSNPTSDPTSDHTSDPTKPGDENNPPTGTIALVPVLMLSGAAVIVAKKRRK